LIQIPCWWDGHKDRFVFCLFQKYTQWCLQII